MIHYHSIEEALKNTTGRTLARANAQINEAIESGYTFSSARLDRTNSIIIIMAKPREVIKIVVPQGGYE